MARKRPYKISKYRLPNQWNPEYHVVGEWGHEVAKCSSKKQALRIIRGFELIDKEDKEKHE